MAKDLERERDERAGRLGALERRHRTGYLKFPADELAVWDRVTVWPPDP